MKFVEINFIKFLSLNIFSISIPEVLDTYCEMLWYPEALKNAESLKKKMKLCSVSYTVRKEELSI